MHGPLYKALAIKIQARLNCKNTDPPNLTWFDQHGQDIMRLADEYLPKGNGIDNGTQINFDRSNSEKLVLETGFHHMDEHGVYTRWTDHTVIVTSSLKTGIALHITGKDCNQIKAYLYDEFYNALTREITY